MGGKDKEQGDGRVTKPERDGAGTLWPPGTSGNAAGMKPGTKQGIRAQLNRLLAKQAPREVIEALKKRKAELDAGTYAEAMTHVLSIAALTGKPADRLAAIKVILEQTEDPRVKRIAPTDPSGEEPYGQETAGQLLDMMQRLANGKGNGKGEK